MYFTCGLSILIHGVITFQDIWPFDNIQLLTIEALDIMSNASIVNNCFII